MHIHANDGISDRARAPLRVNKLLADVRAALQQVVDAGAWLQEDVQHHGARRRRR